MAATILAGVAQQALGYPTPKPTLGSELIATSPQQTATRKVPSIPKIQILSAKLTTWLIGVHGHHTPPNRGFDLYQNQLYAILPSHLPKRVLRSQSTNLYDNRSDFDLGSWIFFFAFLFACNTHFDYFWTNLENQLKCPADFNQINLSVSVSDVIMDFILLIFPIPWVPRALLRCLRC